VDREGFLAEADGGTLFLDEISELPLQHQIKLLDGYPIWPVGGSRDRTVHVRFVGATNRDLEAMSLDGRFREDLYEPGRGGGTDDGVLAWLACDAADAAELARLCAIYRALPPGRIAVPYMSRRLACPGGDSDNIPTCRAHRLLSTSRPAMAENPLEEGLCAGSEKEP
jgi:hypothetical protein